MTNTYAKHVNMKETPQSEPIPGTNQVANSAGGYSFPVTPWTKLDRFLILGSEGGTYYISERKLTKDNAKNVIACLAENGKRVVDRAVEVSERGLAPKNDPALFVLAMAAKLGSDGVRKYALEQLPRVARIGTHLFTFAEFVEALGGWGRATKRALGSWYQQEGSAFQMAKYQSRNGWSTRDILRLAHPVPRSNEEASLFKWAVGGTVSDALPKVILGLEFAKRAETEDEIISLIQAYGLTREMVPTQFLNKPKVQEAMLEKGMPITALIRNLGNLSKSGLLVAGNYAVINKVTDAITSDEALKKGRVHPLSILLATRTYGAGEGFRGHGEWRPVQDVMDALDTAFYKSFAHVEPTNKRYTLGVDISGSMYGGNIAGTHIDCATAAGAMAMVTYKTEKQVTPMAFTTQFEELPLGRKQRLDDVLATMRQMSHRMGGTDCAKPMEWALAHKIETDVFVVYTDSETWAGRSHPVQSLRMYRQAMGIPAKLIVVGLAANDFSIADPSDGGMLDVVGFDASVPEVMRTFVLS